MTPTQMKELLPVAVAWAEGKVVQYAADFGHTWIDYSPDYTHELGGIPSFLAPYRTWRIKPEPPKPMEWWLCKQCGHTLSTKHGGCWTCNRIALHSPPDPVPMILVREVLPSEGGGV